MRSPVARPLIVAASGAVIMALAAYWAKASYADVEDARAPSALTFTKDIAPLLYGNCLSCHRPEGSAPFSLLSYADVRTRAALIADVIGRRDMPPWLPEPGYGRFANERRLRDEQIAMFRQWVDEGLVEGNPADLPRPPSWSGDWVIGTPDLVVALPAYTTPSTGRDVYRNLVAAIPVIESRYVAAVEIRPRHPRVVHHARMMIDSTPSSRSLDALDSAPGFDGMDLESHAVNPDGFFLGWTPGKVPAREVDGMSWRLPLGADLVLQLHLRPIGQPVVVQPVVGFHFTDRPPNTVPTLVMLGSFEIDIPPGDNNYVVIDEYELPVGVDVLSVYPHAHYLGKELQGYAVLPDGRTEWLIRIMDWDFNWQDEYRYETPIPLPAGSRLIMRYTYDNSVDNPQNLSRPPRRVTYGSDSSDEMADLVLQVVARQPEERETLERDLGWKYQIREVSYVARQHYRIGNDLASRGRMAEAIEQFREGLKLRSDDAEIMTAMARALRSLGDVESATLIAERAAQLTGHSDPHVMGELAAVYAAALRRDLAVKAVERALELARAAGLPDLTAELGERLTEYKQIGRR